MLEKIKDPGSAITHFIGMLMAMFAATPLIIKSLHEPDYIHVISLTVFIVSMILLYAASTIYHTLNLSERTNRILRKLDHSMIFVLIASSTPPRDRPRPVPTVCTNTLHKKPTQPLPKGEKR